MPPGGSAGAGSRAMLRPVALYRLSEDPLPALTAPAIVAAFDGWIDAAGASTTAAARIAEGGRALATFDPDALYDYRARRPILDVVDGTLEDLAWPELALRCRRVGDRDVFVLTGPEPDFRWRELAADVLALCLRLGVVGWISLGSLPAAVPHTRPVPVLGTASRPGLLPDDVPQGPSGLLRVPSAALSAVEFAVAGSGIPTLGLYAQVPHYVGAAYPAAAIALLEHVGRHLGVAFETADLRRAAEATRERLDTAVAADEDSRAYVARLELVADEQERPAGEDLIAEIERFLRQRADGGGGEPPPPRPDAPGP